MLKKAFWVNQNGGAQGVVRGWYSAPGPTVATALATKDSSTVRYASIFPKKYGTLVRYAFL